MTRSVSPAVSRFAALGLLLAFVSGAFGYVLVPAARHIANLDGEIELKRELLGRLLDHQKAMPAAGDAAQRGQALLAAEFTLPGETEPIRVANLQAVLRGMAEEAGVQLQSTRTLPPVVREQVPLVGMHLSMRAPIEAVQKLLRRIEVNRPVLVVDGLEIVPVPEGSTGIGGAERLLRVELRVLAHAGAGRKGGEL